MSQYKELADRLQEPGPGIAAFYKACDEAAAILRSLDAQPVATAPLYVSSIYHLAQTSGISVQRWNNKGDAAVFSTGFNGVAIDDFINVMRRAYELGRTDAAPVAAQPQQAKPLNDAEFAINMLEMMFTAYENGVACYEDPEDEVGFVGYAVRLSHDDFNNIGDFLNRVRPVQSGIKEQG